MDPVWLNIWSVLLVFTLAIVSPGPNFIMVINTALADSRRAGVFTSLGVATGSGLFALAGMLGLLLLINSLPYFDVVVPLLGGGYLLWLGVGMIRSSRRKPELTSTQDRIAVGATPLGAYRTGLLTNLTNPKAWAFYFSLFSLVVTPETPLWAKAGLNLAMFAISFTWYASMAVLITDRRVRPGFERVHPPLQTVLGAVLIWLGGRLLVG